MHRTTQTALAIGVLIASASCAMSTDVPEPEQVSTVTEPIWNGIPTPEANSGMVNFGFGGCSGTLLRNQWVLTAAHCVELWRDRDFSAAPFDSTYNGTTYGVALTSGVVDSSGRLVVAGGALVGAGYQFHLERFTAGGALDTSFGVNGQVNFDFLGSTSEGARAVAIQSDGKIVAAGFATFNNTLMFALARFTSAGVPDGNFSFLGANQTDFPASTNEQAFGLVLDSQDRAIAVGISGTKFALARFTTGGVLDPTFNQNGMVTTDLPGSSEQAAAVGIDSNGKIVVVGPAANGFGIARYNSNGSLDTSLNGNGMRVVTGTFSAGAVLLQGTKILVGAQTNQLQPSVSRFNADGSTDTTFGSSGVSKPKFGVQSGQVVGMAFAPNGAIRVAATVITGTTKSKVGYTTISANGVTYPDRVFPETDGMGIEVGSGTVMSGIAAQGGRVFLIGTQGVATGQPQFASAWFKVLTPDRLEDTTFSGALSLSMAGDTFSPDRAYLAPNGDDVAMLHLPTGMMMNGSRTGYWFPGFVNDMNSVLNTTVVCKGYGDTVIVGTGPTTTSGGQLHGGFMNVTNIGTRYVTVAPLPQPNLQNLLLPGDSGGNCDVATSGQYIGVTSLGTFATTGGTSLIVRADRIANWAGNLMVMP